MIQADGNWLMIDGALNPVDAQFEFKTPPIYEVIRLVDGLPLFFEAHMDRLARSFEIAGETVWMSRSEIAGQIRRLTEKEARYNYNARLEMGRDAEGVPHSLLFFSPTSYPAEEMYRQGVRTTMAEIVRETPQAKIFRKGYYDRVSQIRKETGAFEVILHDEAGKLSEGSRSNLFFIKQGSLYSARSSDILLGISRLHVIKCVKDLGIPLVERDIYLDELDDFNACFLSGTSLHLLPIAEIDRHRYASAENELFKRLSARFMEMVAENLDQTRRQYE